MVQRAGWAVLCVWMFASGALAFAGEPLVKGPGLAELRERLRDGDAGKRRSAIRALAKRGEREAWELVLGALTDPEGEVSDQAQLALGGLHDARLVDELLGKRGLRSKDEVVRRRAAEVFGRLEVAVDGPALARGLSDRDAEVRRRLLGSLERLAAAERLEGELGRKVVPAVERRWKGDREPGVRAAALAALARLDRARAVELARKGLADKRDELRCAALWVLAESGASSRELAREVSGDPSPRVRSLLIELHERAGDRDGARSLVDVLDREPRLRLRWSALEALRRISGMKYRMLAKPWRAWAERLPRDWRKGRAPSEGLETGATRVFGGLPLLSDRVTFLFDLSGSLWNRREDGTTRKQYADVQLRRALGSLPEGSAFNIIPYTDRCFPWRDELVPATERNRAAALAEFEALTESGRGNFYDAALLALEDPEVDTVVVLTDGAPTGGEVWSLELLVPLLLDRNRFRKVRFDTLLVDAPRGLHRHWERLAEESGGRVVAVEAADG